MWSNVATSRKTAKSRAKTPSQKFWTAQRKSAFEAVQCGENPGIPDSTLRDWQADPLWREKLAKRDDKLEAIAASLEAERIQLLEKICTNGLKYWDKVLSAEDGGSEFAKLAATRESWALKLRLEAQANQRAQGRIWELSVRAEVWE